MRAFPSIVLYMDEYMNVYMDDPNSWTTQSLPNRFAASLSIENNRNFQNTRENKIPHYVFQAERLRGFKREKKEVV